MRMNWQLSKSDIRWLLSHDHLPSSDEKLVVLPVHISWGASAFSRVLVVRTMTRQNIGSSQCKSQILENVVVATALRSVLSSGVYSELFGFTLFEYFILLWSGFTTGLKLMIYLTNFPSLRLFPYVEGGGRGCTGMVCLINTSLLTWCESVVK